MRNHIKVAVLVAALVSANGPAMAAGAAGIVFDPTDFIKDIATAKQTATVAMQSVQQTVQQIKMVQAWAQDLKQMDAGALLGNLDPNLLKHYGDFINFQRQLKSLERDIDNLENRFRNKAATAFNARMTVGDYVRYQQRQAAEGQAAAQASLDADVETLKRVDRTYQMVQQWQAKIPGIDGSVSGLQMLNSQMSAMLAQNAEIVTALTRERMQRTLDKQDAAHLERRAHETTQELRARAVRERQEANAARKASYEAATDPNRFKIN